jgi:hypothetical protein
LWEMTGALFVGVATPKTKFYYVNRRCNVFPSRALKIDDNFKVTDRLLVV